MPSSGDANGENFREEEVVVFGVTSAGGLKARIDRQSVREGGSAAEYAKLMCPYALAAATPAAL